MCGPSMHPTEGRQSINLVRGVGEAGQTPHWFIRCRRPIEAAIAAVGASFMVDAVQGRDTSLRDTISKGGFVQGAQHPRIFGWGHFGRGHINPASPKPPCSAPHCNQKSHLCIPRKGIARPQSQFPHSCVCERFLYSQDKSQIFLKGIFFFFSFYFRWVVRASDSQCRSRNCSGFDLRILRVSGIWGAADEAVLNIVYKKVHILSCSRIGRQILKIYKSLTALEFGTDAAQILFWECFFRIFSVVSLPVRPETLAGCRPKTQRFPAVTREKERSVQ
jgi:hypothetical protein